MHRRQIPWIGHLCLLFKKKLINKIEKNYAILVSMKRTFQNGMPRKAHKLINVRAKGEKRVPSSRYFGFDNIMQINMHSIAF